MPMFRFIPILSLFSPLFPQDAAQNVLGIEADSTSLDTPSTTVRSFSPIENKQGLEILQDGSLVISKGLNGRLGSPKVLQRTG